MLSISPSMNWKIKSKYFFEPLKMPHFPKISSTFNNKSFFTDMTLNSEDSKILYNSFLGIVFSLIWLIKFSMDS